MSIVIDASAVLAIRKGERGGDVAEQSARGTLLGAVNLSEILAKASDLGTNPGEVRALNDRLEIEIAAFNERQADIAASLRCLTRYMNVALADRARLALAIYVESPVLTADTKWAEIDLGGRVEIILIR